jgi:hypothetical protein
MNNEPVAWIIDVNMTDYDDNFIWNTGDYPDWQVKDWIPLYTHPNEHDLGIAEAIGFDKGYAATQAKTLTDEEIDDCAYETGMWCDGTPDAWDSEAIKNFAKAILKKAQEK